MLVGIAFQAAKKFLTDHGVADARASAIFLLAGVLGYQPSELVLHRDESMTDQQHQMLQRYLERRSRHEPVWYILGQQDFCGLPIEADQRVLIPRPETEQLVELVLASIESTTVKIVVDVGTGSGAISIALAKARPDLQYTATDVSPDALALARTNAKRNEVDINFVVASGLQPTDSSVQITADVVIANLPYIPQDRLAELAPEVRDYEPLLALDGGPDGLDCYRQLFDQLAQSTQLPQLIFCEIDETHGQTFPDLCHRYFPQAQIKIEQDMAGLDRFAIITL